LEVSKAVGEEADGLAVPVAGLTFGASEPLADLGKGEVILDSPLDDLLHLRRQVIY
jgi:hypothetical protein